MSAVSEDVSEKCRLCSSKKNLISLFSGKAKDRRDYLRKLIQDLLNITIEYDDTISTRVCIVCCVYIYNFYTFKELTKTTESVLNSLTKNTRITPHSTKTKKKGKVVLLKDVKLPGYQDLQKTLSSWLIAKYADIKHNESTPESGTALNEGLIDVGILTDPPSLCSRYVQIEIETADNTCQTVRNLNEAYVQTELLKSTTDKSSQCRNPTKNKDTQADFQPQRLKANSFTQTDTPSVSNTVTQCDLCKKLEVICPKTYKEKSMFMTALDLNHSDAIDGRQINKVTRSPRRLRNDVHVAIPPKVIVWDSSNKSLEEKSTQTDFVNYPNNYYNDTMLLTISKNISDLKTVPLNIITDKCSKLNGIKKENVSPKDCPKSNSSTDGNSKGIPLIPSPAETTELLSPRSATLMKIGKKHHRVYICGMCDNVTYTIKEKALHRKTHLQCSLCKRRFRSLENADAHRKECGKCAGMTSAKKSEKQGETVDTHAEVNGNLFVMLTKLDFDDSSRTLYPSAFAQLNDMAENQECSDSN